jgi:hypothetical protein
MWILERIAAASHQLASCPNRVNLPHFDHAPITSGPPEKQTFSVPVGMPQGCQFLTHAPQQNASCDMPATFGLPSTAYMALRRENWRYALRNATSARPNA